MQGIKNNLTTNKLRREKGVLCKCTVWVQMREGFVYFPVGLVLIPAHLLLGDLRFWPLDSAILSSLASSNNALGQDLRVTRVSDIVQRTLLSRTSVP